MIQFKEKSATILNRFKIFEKKRDEETSLEFDDVLHFYWEVRNEYSNESRILMNEEWEYSSTIIKNRLELLESVWINGFLSFCCFSYLTWEIRRIKW